MSNPVLKVTLNLQETVVENPIQLDLSYLHFVDSEDLGQWTDADQFALSQSQVGLGSYELALLEGWSSQTVDVRVQTKDIAKFKKHPALLKAQVVNADGIPLGNEAIGFSFFDEIELIHVSALAFDNPMYSGGNRAPQIRETVMGIKAASLQKPEILSVVLADSYGDENSQIYYVYQNEIIPAGHLMNGLPNSSGIIDSSISEYDMGDGDTLGGFLKWVRGSSLNQRMSFSYYGHGSAIMPTIEAQRSGFDQENVDDQGSGPITMPSWVHVQPSWVHVQPSWVHVQPSWVHVQPSWVHVQPSWVHVQPSWIIEEDHFATDSYPLSLISIKDIARAVQLGTDDGKYPLAVLDLVHCFSLSIEQVYELAPYVDSIIGSANYHFFDSRMPGKALLDISPHSGSLQLADAIMHSYDETLPQVGYPRTMAVIDGRQVASIKTYWDEAAAEIMTAFSQDHSGTRSKLQTAYHNVTKYDSTSCDNEFTLQSPDALVDFYEMATQIETQFADNPSIAQAAQLASSQIDAAVYSTVNSSGNPWFGTSEADHWNFSGKGLSIFADLHGISDSNSRAVGLSWQTAFYNRLPTDIHLTPFEFLASENNSPTWADVIETSWEGYEVYPQSCLITIPPDHDEADVVALDINLVGNRSAKDAPGKGRVILAEIATSAPLGNIMIQFEIIQNGNVSFTEVIYTGWLDAGNHDIFSTTVIDEEILNLADSIQVTLDPHGYLIESTLSDNKLSVSVK